MRVLIAYNNDNSEDLHLFFESCADEVKQCCVDKRHEYNPVFPPALNEENVCHKMSDCEICFIAAHGKSDGVYNTNVEPIVSVKTTNYNFKDKVFYSVACNCGQCLLPELKGIGLNTFVGYDDELRIIESEPAFIESVLSGIKSLLNGDSIEVAKSVMNRSYSECIANAKNKHVKRLLVHNKEHLHFE